MESKSLVSMESLFAIKKSALFAFDECSQVRANVGLVVAEKELKSEMARRRERLKKKKEEAKAKEREKKPHVKGKEKDFGFVVDVNLPRASKSPPHRAIVLIAPKTNDCA